MSTFSEQFKKILAGSPELEPKSKRIPARRRPPCASCGGYILDLNENGLCARCQIDKDRGYTVSTKAGRCANGAERDGGTLFHARMLNEHGAEWAPFCGVAPGKRSAGWSTWRPSPDQPVTCPRCLKKLERNAR